MADLIRRVAEELGGAGINVLEVGSWAGASATTFALALRKYNGGRGAVMCVDPWQPYHTTEQLSQDNPKISEMDKGLREDQVFNLFWHNVRTLDNQHLIMPLRGMSARVMNLLAQSSFQIVFIDGDHRYDSVKQDLLNSMKLVAVGGGLCGDDLELQMDQIDVDYARKNHATEYTVDPKSGEHFHPGVTLAVGELFGTVSSAQGFWCMQNARDGWKGIDLGSVDGSLIPDHLVPPAVAAAGEPIGYLQSNDKTAHLLCRGS